MAKRIYTGVGGTARKVKRIYTGVNGTARKVKRVYVGDSNGIARLCWSSGEVAKYGQIDALPKYTALNAGQNKNYAVVINSQYAYSYDKNLTLTQHGSVSSYSPYWTTAGSVGEYVLFAGGVSSTYYTESKNTILAYDGSMTRKVLSLPSERDSMGAANVGSYVLFAGGEYNYETEYSDGTTGISTDMCSTVYAYNASLTRTNVSSLSGARQLPKGGSVGNYAVFAGGETYGGGRGGETAVVDAYNSSLTRTTASSLSKARYLMGAATIGKYLIFAGGYLYGSEGNTANASIDCYDTSLTKISIETLSNARSSPAGATLGDYALFAGGQKYYNSTIYDTVDMYDESLTRTTGTPLYAARTNVKAAKVGDYLLFLGGSNASNTLYQTDVYMLD